MPTYNSTSCKEVLGKVYRDLQMEDSHWEADAIEWIGEGLEMIGAATQLERRQEVHSVQNYKLPLPSDLAFIRGLYKVPENVTFTGAGDTLTYDAQEVESSAKRRVPRKGEARGRGYLGSLHKGVGAPETSHPASHIKETYVLNPGVIKTSWEKSLVVLDYKAIATDDDGYPLIPDEAHYKEALFWRIAMKLFLRGYQHPQLNYQLAVQQWKSYAGKARTKAKMPDVDEMENFREMWVRFVNQGFRGEGGRHSNTQYGTDHLTD